MPIGSVESLAIPAMFEMAVTLGILVKSEIRES